MKRGLTLMALLAAVAALAACGDKPQTAAKRREGATPQAFQGTRHAVRRRRAGSRATRRAGSSS